ncbi:hypothetical protein JCM11957_14310 [Caminibacter profundus]
MNRVEKYLQELNKKNKILLYISIIILGFIIYYNFNYSYLNEKYEKLHSQVNALYKKVNISFYDLQNKLKNLKQTYKLQYQKNSSLQEDYRYLKVLINTSEVLTLNEKKFFSILETILKMSSQKGINSSYEIEQNKKDLLIYKVKIYGNFAVNNFLNFLEFVKTIEKIKAIKKISNLKLEYKDQEIKFDMICEFWSIK